MPREKVVVGVDVGSTKTTTLIATTSPNEAVNVIGVATHPSRGIKKSQIVNIDEAVESISQSLEAAERMAGYSVGSAFVSVGGTHLSCQNSKGVVAVAEPEKEITSSDVLRVMEAAKAINLSSSLEIIHAIPRGFLVDGQGGIKDPRGMTGVRLEAETHIIVGSTTALRNLIKCLDQVGVEVVGLVFSGVASAEAVLSETEKELGVVLLDIGGGTTDLCLYLEGSLTYSAVIPVGAQNITNDLAIGLRITLESAEKIKLLLSETPKKITHPQKDQIKEESDEIELEELKLPEEIKKVSRKTVIEGIIRPRLNEIFTLVAGEIKKSGFGGLTPAGLVLAGGGAQTVGIIDSGKRILAMPARIGFPQNIRGLIDEIQTPAFATAVGLVISGQKEASLEKGISFTLPQFSKIPLTGVLNKALELFKSFLP